jgi:plastocyanin
MRLRRILLATLLPATLVGPALVLAGPAGAGGGTCHSTSVTTGKGQAVEMRNNCFSPTVLHAPLGEAVTFVNRDAAPHTVTGAGEWGTGQKEVFRGQSFRLRFREPGLYLYACMIHPGMIGAVYVGSGRGIDVANSDSVTPPDDMAADGSSSETPGTEELETEAASASEDAPGAPTGVVALLGVAAVGAGFGIGRLRRRAPRGKSA